MNLGDTFNTIYIHCPTETFGPWHPKGSLPESETRFTDDGSDLGQIECRSDHFVRQVEGERVVIINGDKRETLAPDEAAVALQIGGHVLGHVIVNESLSANHPAA